MKSSTESKPRAGHKRTAAPAQATAAAAATTPAEALDARQPLSISALARRAGVAASALRFYEAQGLIEGSRSAGGHRQYPRHVLRRVAFIRAAQALGLSLPEIAQTLRRLPDGRTPTKADWARLTADWVPLVEARIAALEALRDKLASCIGCGCLSLKSCGLYNPQDAAAVKGPGAQFLLRSPKR